MRDKTRVEDKSWYNFQKKVLTEEVRRGLEEVKNLFDKGDPYKASKAAEELASNLMHLEVVTKELQTIERIKKRN